MTTKDTDEQLDKRPYITVTNELFRHPKFVRLNDKAKLHLLELWGYCNEYQTDGVVHRSMLEAKGKPVAKQLREGGWVDDTVEAEWFYMHDYLDHQKSKDQIEDAKSKKRDAGSAGGKRSHHVRNHVNKGAFHAECQWCVEDRRAS